MSGNVEIMTIARGGAEHAILAFKRPRDGGDAPARTIVGQFPMKGTMPDWSRFSPSPAFLAFFTAYMKGNLPVAPDILAEARVNPGEFVYVIDRRTPTPNDDVPFRDIIGWYTSAEDGSPIADSFEYNDEHQLALADGTLSSILADSQVYRAILA